MTPQRLNASLILLCALQAGYLFSSWLSFDARAEPMPPLEVPQADALELFCKPFETRLEGGSAAFETSDRTTAMGRWIAEHSSRYEVHSVDFEMAQKSTGYPIAYNQVCLRARH